MMHFCDDCHQMLTHIFILFQFMELEPVAELDEEETMLQPSLSVGTSFHLFQTSVIKVHTYNLDYAMKKFYGLWKREKIHGLSEN